MKVLSLLQPWASLVVIGAKKIETRSWTTRHRGRLLIHASTGKAGSFFAADPPFSKYIPAFNELPFGAIIGEVTLVDICRVEELPFSGSEINKLALEEKAFGDYSAGRYAWLLEDPVMFKIPLKAKGQLGLWEYPDDLLDQELGGVL
jgi:activating signal cointegrator 1